MATSPNTTTDRYFIVRSSISSADWVMDRERPCHDGCADGHHVPECNKIVQTVESGHRKRVLRYWNA